MRRSVYHVSILVVLLVLLTSCGQYLSGASSISGTVTAPTGADVKGTRVYACYDGDAPCDRLAETTLTGSGDTSPYQLGDLPQGSYTVYAVKTSSPSSEPGAGDLYGYFGRNEGVPKFVTPPQSNVNIEMLVLTGSASLQSLPATLRQALTASP